MKLTNSRLLTKKQVEILKYVAEGNSNKKIAFLRGISESTTKNQMTWIMIKLGASDRTHAVVIALQQSYFTLEELNNVQTNLPNVVSR